MSLPGLISQQGGHGITGRRSSRVWIAAVDPAAAKRPMIGDKHPIPRLVPEPTHRTCGLHSYPEVYRRARQVLREFHPYVDGEFTTGP